MSDRVKHVYTTVKPQLERMDGCLDDSGSKGIFVDTTINVVERQSAGFSGGGGISAKGLQEGGLSALIANADYFRR